MYEHKHTWHILHGLLTLCFLPYGLIWFVIHQANCRHNDAVDDRLHQITMAGLPDGFFKDKKEKSDVDYAHLFR